MVLLTLIYFKSDYLMMYNRNKQRHIEVHYKIGFLQPKYTSWYLSITLPLSVCCVCMYPDP